MVHTAQSEVGKKTWDSNHWGPKGALVDGHSIYYASWKTHSDRVQWLSMLYSALGDALPAARRGNVKSMRRAAWCLWHLRPQIRYFSRDQAIAETFKITQAVTIAGVMIRWSDLPLLGGKKFLRAAEGFALIAYCRSDTDACGGHDHALACITLTTVKLAEGNRNAAGWYFGEAKRLAPCIDNANQKSRVYRGIARLEPRFTNLREAKKFLDLADAVPGIAEDVKKKNAVARRELGL